MKLSERQERILMSYLDGEAGALGRIWARWLMRSAAAQEFAAEFRELSAQAKNHFSEAGADECPDLWPRIDQRITAEERAELFLGRRRFKLPEVQERPFSGLYWGLSGALAAGCLVLAFMYGGWGAGGAAQDGSLNFAARQEPVPNVNLVSTNGGDSYRRPRLLEELDAPAVELEWMRSDGRVRLLQDRARRSTIIWVKRRGLLPTNSGVDAEAAREQAFGKPGSK